MRAPYTALDSSHHEIRLLELTPGSHDDDLFIELHIASLDQKLPEYYALSYAWGQGVSPRMAFVGGEPRQIGNNLDCALRHIRCGLNNPILVWVDALCINQQDLEERSSQVLLMKDIYSSAERVLIWLGSEQQGDAYAVACIRNNEVSGPVEHLLGLIRSVESICRRPWFGRVWVAQELALSQRDPVIYIGTTTVPWSQFDQYIRQLEKRLPPSLDTHLSMFALMQATGPVTRLGRVRAFRTTSLNLQIYRSAASLATDSRDKVYGLLGLCVFTPSQPSITPDYTNSTQRVFSEATISMLQEGENLPYDLLPLRHPRNFPAESPYQPLADLPTWALDLNISSQAPAAYGQNNPYWFLPSRAIHPGPLLKDTCHIPGRVTASHASRRLHTQGAHLGIIIATSVAKPDPERPNYHARAAALRAFYDVHLKPREISAHALLQALTIDGKTPVRDPRLKEQLPHLFEQLVTSQTHIENPSPYHDVLMALSGHEECYVFVTDTDQVGIAYHPDVEGGIRVGDEVIGLFGINFPFVLRSVSGGLDNDPAYTMINIAHIADHQWGHRFLKPADANARWSDFRENGLQEYTIV
jgi:hypothetical protein